GSDRGVSESAAVVGGVHGRATESRALAHALTPLPARARGLSAGARRPAGLRTGVERRWTGARRAEALYRRAQRVRARRRSRSTERRRPLQSELHTLESRGLRRRAAGDQTGTRARSVLRIAKILARDRSPVRNRLDRHRAGDFGRRAGGESGRRIRFRSAVAGQHFPRAGAGCHHTADCTRWARQEGEGRSAGAGARLRQQRHDGSRGRRSVARARAAAGDAAGALTALRQAQTRAPDRADLHKLQGDIALKVGDRHGARQAYRAALDLDQGFVQVWLELGRLHEQDEEWEQARRAYEEALEALPTFHEAALALADLLRR